MQVLVVDPLQEIGRRAEHVLGGAAVSVAVTGSLHSPALTGATADDALPVDAAPAGAGPGIDERAALALEEAPAVDAAGADVALAGVAR